MAVENKTTKKGSGILGGLLLLVIGVGILWSNEGRTVKTQSAISEAKKTFINVKSDKVNSKNEGKLVATKGKITLDEDNMLKDDIFGISKNAVKLKRKVEMYQWNEECETDENDNEKCTYKKVWDEDLIDSSEFSESGHNNPSEMLYETEEYISEDVHLGAFILPEELIKSLKYDKKVGVDQIKEQYNNSKENVKVSDRYLSTVKEDTPEIGDIRISYEYTTPKAVSVMAVQTDNTFEAFTSKKGKDIYTIVEGNKTGIQILENMASSNKAMKWFLRFLGVFLVISGFTSMFSLLSNLTSKVPVLGSIVGGATSLVSTILGIATSLIVISIAWFRFRPVLSIILIVIVVALILFLKFFKPETKEVKDTK